MGSDGVGSGDEEKGSGFESAKFSDSRRKVQLGNFASCEAVGWQSLTIEANASGSSSVSIASHCYSVSMRAREWSIF